MKPVGYFSKDLTASELVKLYDKLGVKLEGNVAIKLYSGELAIKIFSNKTFFDQLLKRLVE